MSDVGSVGGVGDMGGVGPNFGVSPENLGVSQKKRRGWRGSKFWRGWSRSIKFWRRWRESIKFACVEILV